MNQHSISIIKNLQIQLNKITTKLKMFRNKSSIIVLAFLLAMNIALVHSTTHYLDLDDALVAEKVRKNPVSMSVGEVLKIIVNENPVTGYQWYINDPALISKTPKVELIGEYFVNDASNKEEGIPITRMANTGLRIL